MNIILLEDSTIPIDSFLDKVYEKFPSSCRLYLNNRNFKESAHYLKERPVLLDKYLVILSDKISSKQLIEAMGSDHLVILLLKSKDKVLEFSSILKTENIIFQFVDCLEKQDFAVIEYVIKELNITKKDAIYLCNRHAIRRRTVTSKTKGSYNLRAVINSVNVLSVFDKVTPTIIKKYTDRRLDGSLNSIVESLLGVSKSPKATVIQVIERYRYGLDFLLKFICKELDKYLLLYKYLDEGELNLENYKDFNPNNDTDKDLYNKISEYQRKKIIETHLVVSWDLLYFTKVSVASIDSNPNDIFELILLLKEGTKYDK